MLILPERLSLLLVTRLAVSLRHLKRQSLCKNLGHMASIKSSIGTGETECWRRQCSSDGQDQPDCC